jgi:murein DD-endopeptidase MepM/ murein hydrolase activator NlpD
MKKHILAWGVLALLFFCTNVFSEPVVTRFVYPVGDKNSAPTESWSNANGYHISQNFNTSREWDDGGANGGWCSDVDTFVQTKQQSEKACTDAGNRWTYGHTGVDLSKGDITCITRTSEREVRAIAAGTIEHANPASGYGNLVKIRHLLPNGNTIYSLYGHVQDNSFQVYKGNTVTAGQVIAYVGDRGAGGNCHLHFAIYAKGIQLDSILIAPVGYVYDDEEGETQNGNTIYSNTMKYFYDPLLFVDDRNTRYALMLSCCNILQIITPTYSILTKTMYAEDGSGQTLSLQKAADAGWIYPYVYMKDAVTGGWGYYATWKIDEFVLRKGLSYAFRAKKSGVNLRYFKPGNNYLEARSRQDMMEFAATNSKFSGLNRETYGINKNQSATRARAWMNFDYWSNGWTNTYALQEYDLNDPLRRWVAYYVPATNSWTPWVSWY